MATHRTGSTTSSPLRERLLSNSPDPIKSSILRESGKGWSSPPSEPSKKIPTTPLRISKRDSPMRRPESTLDRRSSSSYKHMRTNNLVSKSPFKSQIPTPSHSNSSSAFFPLVTRKVSGEKRPRPSSMHEQAELENERPFALKRERRQSKAFQGLIEKEPVTNSPFRRPQGARSPIQMPPPVPSIPTYVPPSNNLVSTPEAPRPHPPSNASPVRSSLISRRMHGPRLSGGGRRERRKTVTFDECLDVVEISEEEADSDEWHSQESDNDRHDDPDDGDFFMDTSSTQVDRPSRENSFDMVVSESAGYSLELDPNASITGIVDDLLNLTKPPHSSVDIPTDLDTSEGIPFSTSTPPRRQRSQSPFTLVTTNSPSHGRYSSSPRSANTSTSILMNESLNEEQLLSTHIPGSSLQSSHTLPDTSTGLLELETSQLSDVRDEPTPVEFHHEDSVASVSSTRASQVRRACFPRTLFR